MGLAGRRGGALLPRGREKVWAGPKRQEYWVAIADIVNATAGKNRAVAKVEKNGQI